MNEKELAEKYLTQRSWRKATGYAFNTQEMNPDDYDEIFFEGDTMEDALHNLHRKIDNYWVYEPAEDSVDVHEDIWDAVESCEEQSDVSYDDFKKSELSRNV